MTELLYVCSDVCHLRQRTYDRGATQRAGHQCSICEFYRRLILPFLCLYVPFVTFKFCHKLYNVNCVVANACLCVRHTNKEITVLLTDILSHVLNRVVHISFQRSTTVRLDDLMTETFAGEEVDVACPTSWCELLLS